MKNDTITKVNRGTKIKVTKYYETLDSPKKINNVFYFYIF